MSASQASKPRRGALMAHPRSLHPHPPCRAPAYRAPVLPQLMFSSTPVYSPAHIPALPCLGGCAAALVCSLRAPAGCSPLALATTTQGAGPEEEGEKGRRWLEAAARGTAPAAAPEPAPALWALAAHPERAPCRQGRGSLLPPCYLAWRSPLQAGSLEAGPSVATPGRATACASHLCALQL